MRNVFEYYDEGSHLEHHGILGQKWGVRRYQNPDGTLTEAGKRRMQRAQSDARNYATQHAYLEDMTRDLTRNVKSGQQILVPTDVKAHYSSTLNSFRNLENELRKKYKYVESSVVTDNGKDYVVSVLVDKKTGWGAETRVELKNK